jgi:hypothetical protein
MTIARTDKDMAKVVSNELMKALRGALGELVFRQMPDGSVVSVRSIFHRRTPFSRAQKDHQSRLKEASMYAGFAAKSQPIYTELARGTLKTAYNIALSDWFNPPVIHQVQWSDGQIRVEAIDDVLVTKVQVTVLDEGGQVLEKGEAIRSHGNWWEFSSHARGSMIIAEAWDLPGHAGRLVT